MEGFPCTAEVARWKDAVHETVVNFFPKRRGKGLFHHSRPPRDHDRNMRSRRVIGTDAADKELHTKHSEHFGLEVKVFIRRHPVAAEGDVKPRVLRIFNLLDALLAMRSGERT